MDSLENQERIQRPLSERYNADPIGVVNSTYDDINDQADYSVIPADYNVIPADYITPINVHSDEYTQHIKIETQHRNHYENGDYLSFEHQQRETRNSENIQREYKINQDDDGYVKANGIQQQN
ncbi:hypothetical protein FSP39_021716 [Pinctada imbricata]|uniref:Uncharacterized protein n=1 Tax=Pinctada imbricata TaxID=66713 RepID=A0AA89BWA5_PINIB|nr:hypothetical protein FSP39_021716 [Pinctada imbricata]